MQLTRFDRWLREKFVYETHIQTLRLPEYIPAGIRTVELPDSPGKRFKHLFIARSSKAADELIQTLRENSQMYSTQIVDRDWWLISVIVIAVSAFFVLLYLKGLVQDPEFRKNFTEALEILKG